MPNPPAKSFLSGLRNPLAGVGEYWADDNAAFQAQNPSVVQQTLRAANPLTGFGSALGRLHTAAGEGDLLGAGLAAGGAALSGIPRIPVPIPALRAANQTPDPRDLAAIAHAADNVAMQTMRNHHIDKGYQHLKTKLEERAQAKKDAKK
jgi:hypothetical protein